MRVLAALLSVAALAFNVATVSAQDDPACDSDVNADGVVNVTDLLELLGAFGSADSASDSNGDGIVNVADLLALLSVFSQECTAAPPGTNVRPRGLGGELTGVPSKGRAGGPRHCGIGCVRAD